MKKDTAILSNYEEYLLVKSLQQGSIDRVPSNIKLIVQKLDDKVLESTGQTAKGLPFETIADELLGVDSYDKWLEFNGMKPNEYEFDDNQKTEIESAIEMKFDEVESLFEPTIIESVKDRDTLNVLLEDDYEAELQQSLNAALNDDVKSDVKPGKVSVKPVEISADILNQISATKTPKQPKTKQPKIISTVQKPMIDYPLHMETVNKLLKKIEHTMNLKDVTGVEMNWKEGRQTQFEREFHKLKRSTDSSQYFVRNGIAFDVDATNATIFVMDNGPEFTVFTFDEDFIVILDRNTKVGNKDMNLVFAGSPTTDSDKLSKLLTRYKAAMVKYKGEVPGAIRW